MVKRVLFLSLIVGGLASASGCGVCHAILYEPFGPGVGPCERNCAAVAAHEGGCDDCAAAVGCGIRGRAVCRRSAGACDAPCNDACDDPCRPCCGPLTWLFSIFGGNSYRCGGCGDRYWGEWHSDPPDCCDPCTRCGRYVGGAAPVGGPVMGPEPIPPGAPVGAAVEPGCRDCARAAQAGYRQGAVRAASQPRRTMAAYPSRIVPQSDRVVSPAEPATVQTARTRQGPALE